MIKKNKFVPDEPEYNLLSKFIKCGDWIIDVGANVGHYTKAFSEFAGNEGRVLAFEPVPETFSILSANTLLFRHQNVTLVNAAVSDTVAKVNMTIPKFKSGLNNFYQAAIDDHIEGAGCLPILTVFIDGLHLNSKVSLVKIDAEGHELHVIKGMLQLIKTFHPVLIVETDSDSVVKLLKDFGYRNERLPGSPNMLFQTT